MRCVRVCTMSERADGDNSFRWLCSSQRACEYSGDAAQAEVDLHGTPRGAALGWDNRAAATRTRPAGRGRGAPAAVPSTGALSGRVEGLPVRWSADHAQGYPPTLALRQPTQKSCMEAHDYASHHQINSVRPQRRWTERSRYCNAARMCATHPYNVVAGVRTNEAIQTLCSDVPTRLRHRLRTYEKQTAMRWAKNVRM